MLLCENVSLIMRQDNNNNKIVIEKINTHIFQLFPFAIRKFSIKQKVLYKGKCNFQTNENPELKENTHIHIGS